MNFKMMGRFLAQILSVEGVFMLPPLFISLYHRETQAVIGFTASILILLVITGLLFWLCRGARSSFYAREGLTCVAISWFVMSLTGCLPFYISGEIPSFVDALFEIASGFTTTGASILNDIEALSKGLLFWRSFSHWIGGMGVLVFLLAISPSGNKGGGYTMHLLRAESPGPSVGKLVPKMRQTAGILYIIYIALTVLAFIFYFAGGIPLFDAVTAALSTAGTGGFSIKNDSMASYSPYIQYVCASFMLLFGVNFTCFYLMVLRQFKSVLKYEELRLYLGMAAAATGIITFVTRNTYGTLEEAFRHAFFQVASLISSTGFATTDYDTLWPPFAKSIIVCIMLIGACAGSTGGGFKCARFLIILKNLRRNIRQVLNPQRVQVVRINKEMVSEKVLTNTSAFLASYVIIMIVGFLLISVDNFSMGTNISAIIACINNMGPGFDAVGPVCNYSGYSAFSKLVLTFIMIAGRLEIFPVLVLFSRDTWKHK